VSGDPMTAVASIKRAADVCVSDGGATGRVMNERDDGRMGTTIYGVRCRCSVVARRRRLLAPDADTSPGGEVRDTGMRTTPRDEII